MENLSIILSIVASLISIVSAVTTYFLKKQVDSYINLQNTTHNIITNYVSSPEFAKAIDNTQLKKVLAKMLHQMFTFKDGVLTINDALDFDDVVDNAD